MKKLKLIIAICMFILFISTAYAVYEPMREVEEEDIVVEEIQEEQFIYPTDLIAKVNSTLGSWTLAEAIVIWCQNHSEDVDTCIKNVYWVATAESSLFKNVGSSNNAFWLMYKGKLRRFTSIEEWVIQRIKLYEKNNRQARGLSWQRWLDGKYCASECKYRISNYNSGIAIAESVL